MNLSAMLQKGARIFIKPHRFTTPWEGSKPTVYLVRHNNLKGPLDAFVSLPQVPHIWVLDLFFSFAECYRQYRCYTFSERRGKAIPKISFKAAVAAAVAVPLVKLSRAIPVYRGKRNIRLTFEKSMEVLKKKESIVIAVDKDYADTTSAVQEIYNGFFHLKQYYFDTVGEHLPFVALRFEKNGSIVFSEEMIFSGEVSFRLQRKDFTEKMIAFFNERNPLWNTPSSYNKLS